MERIIIYFCFIHFSYGQIFSPYDPWKLSRINENVCETSVRVVDERPGDECVYYHYCAK